MGELDIEDAEYEKIPPKKKLDWTLIVWSLFLLAYVLWGLFFLFCD